MHNLHTATALERPVDTVTPTKQQLVAAMRASALEMQSRGLWSIRRQILPPALRAWAGFTPYPDLPLTMTSLTRWTEATLNQPFGESVMSDDPRELRKHLPIVMAAYGQVLVTGLGLGCVVRGLLARPQVEHIDVVELDRDVLAMVGDTFAGEPRVTIHHGDARTFPWPFWARWDFAWHDVWSEKPETQVVHAELLLHYRWRVTHQGAWGFPRWVKRRWFPLIGGARRRHESDRADRGDRLPIDSLQMERIERHESHD